MRDQKHRSPLGSGNAAERFAVAGAALGEVRGKNRVNGFPVIVEGRRDKIALETLGFTGSIEVLNRGWNLERFITHMYETYGTRGNDGGPAICLLMDWDRTGGRLQNELRRRFESMDVKVGETLRGELLRALKPETSVVEALSGLAPNLRPFIDEEDPVQASEP
ncbi:MAG: hypothetical protein CMA63_03655 [Euryarchaeota archaeon]|nr:hypothetical protein [Euryarchaeota archaeon]